MPDARSSTYSGAPSLQPSLAPTMDTISNRSSTQQSAVRYSDRAYLHPAAASSQHHSRGSSPEKHASSAFYDNASATTAGSSLTLYAATDPRAADIKSFAQLLDKMAEPRLDKQRYVMSGHKTEEVSKIALGAKVERALARRMTGQDAVFTSKAAVARPTSFDEKAKEAIRAN